MRVAKTPGQEKSAEAIDLSARSRTKITGSSTWARTRDLRINRTALTAIWARNSKIRKAFSRFGLARDYRPNGFRTSMLGVAVEAGEGRFKSTT